MSSTGFSCATNVRPRWVQKVKAGGWTHLLQRAHCRAIATQAAAEAETGGA
jgi:hypothetical protein